ncbi:MAG: hypothetical protein P8163_22770 [Candidatus Thiodiazotropha sp.]
MKWKLKQSTAKNSKKVCVIKLNKNNLTGEFMVLSNLGNNEYEYRPGSVGIYRVMHNIDKSKKAIKGCQLVYEIEYEKFMRRLNISDKEVMGFSNGEIQNSEFVNELGWQKRIEYDG